MAKVMTVVRRALGGAAVDTVQELIGEVAKARRERADALAAAERLECERLVAESFEQAQELARQIERARWDAERADARLPELEQRLNAARAREQAAALEKHRMRRAAIYRRLRAAIVAAGEIQGEAIRADQEACAELGEGLVRGHLPPIAYRGFLMPDLIELWTADQDRMFAAPVQAPKAQTTTAPRVPSQPRSSTQHAVRLGLNDSGGAIHAPPVADDTAPLVEDELRCVVIRSGFQTPSGLPCRSGQKIRLPRLVATEAARHGAVEILQENHNG